MQIIVATGFIAKNPQGQVTTLKRNGSDYSATIIGALVRGSHITIWTDVDGVYSADPRKVCFSSNLFIITQMHPSSWHRVWDIHSKYQHLENTLAIKLYTVRIIGTLSIYLIISS